MKTLPIMEDWYLLLFKPRPWLKHSCRVAWRRHDDTKLPNPGNGPHYRTMPMCPELERFWCRYCGEVASQAVTDIALLAGVYAYDIPRPESNHDWDEFI